MAFQIYNFNTEEERNFSLIQHILSLIDAYNNSITIACSGGKSPIPFFTLLSQQDIKWNQINIALVDERIVPTTHKDSNTLLIHNHLLQHHASKAKFIPIINDTFLSPLDTTSLLKFANNNYKQPDIVILGMGTDGHTASLFACASEFQSALTTQENIVLTSPKNAPHQRLSMSLSAIQKCKHIFLVIQGEEKLKVFQQALNTQDFKFPISHIFNLKEVQNYVYYAK